MSHNRRMGEVFSALAGIGVVVLGATGLVKVVCVRSPSGPCFCDPADLRAHWRGAVKLGLVLIAIALAGGLATASLG